MANHLDSGRLALLSDIIASITTRHGNENMLARNLLLMSICLLAIGRTSIAAEPLQALIIDGQNNHVVWPKTTIMMKKFLEQTTRFKVDIARTKFTWNGEDYLKEFPLEDGKEYVAVRNPKQDRNFAPAFSDYDVVISNFGYNAADWPKKTQAALEAYMSGGGGLVVVHAADNSFGKWKEFNRMIGLGGWGGRTEKSGPYVYFDDEGKPVRDQTKGSGGSHGAQHDFPIIVRDPDHPITQGMPRAWMHAQDELYDRLRGPAENMTILATAYSDKSTGGSGRHEPMLMAIEYGDGRVFHTPLGHDEKALRIPGAVHLLRRGCAWAAGRDP